MIDMQTAYHIEYGPSVMAKTDAKQAISQHPAEWSTDPWSPEETRDWLQKKYEAEVQEAERTGKPKPSPPEDPVVTAEMAKAEAEYQDRVKEAKMLVARDDKMRREKEEYEAAVAAARAFLAQPGPMQFEPERVPHPEQKNRAAAARGQVQAEDEDDPAELGDTAPDPMTVIPTDWKERKNSFRKGLALRLGADKHIKQGDVNAFIEGEIAKRDAAKAT